MGKRFFDSGQILQVGYHWPNDLEQRDFYRNLGCPPYQHAPPKMTKNHTIFGLENECYHSAQVWNTNGTSSLQHLLTLVVSKKMKNPYIDTFLNNLGGDSPKQLNFTAKIAQFQPHFLHLMPSQILHSKQS